MLQRVFRVLVVGFALVLLAAAPAGAQAADAHAIVIDHRWANSDAQSLIGLPHGVAQDDGGEEWVAAVVAMVAEAEGVGLADRVLGADGWRSGDRAVCGRADGDIALRMRRRRCTRGAIRLWSRSLRGGGTVRLEELAFSVDPERIRRRCRRQPQARRGMDVVRLVFTNDGATRRRAFW